MNSSVRQPRVRFHRLFQRGCVLARTAVAFGGFALTLTATTSEDQPSLRVGFSAQQFLDVNENDARAALKIWASAMGNDRGIPVHPFIAIFKSVEEIQDALLNNEVDCVGLTTVELWKVRQKVSVWPTVVFGHTDAGIDTEFVLLVHRDSPIQQLADLHGQSLLVHGNVHEEFALIWLETELLEAKLGRASAFWGKVASVPKLSRTVLPVFFKQTDACLVTRESFRTMSELNPQVGRQLRIIATSPPVITVPFVFRSVSESPLREQLLAEVGSISETTMGRQTLALFHTNALIAHSIDELEPSFAILDRHQHLLSSPDAPATRIDPRTPPPRDALIAK